MKLYYTQKGTAPKTLIFLHGFMENHTMWRVYQDYFSKDYTVITPDLLGHGKTPCNLPIIEMQDQSENLHKLIQQKELNKIILVGHSMGGYILLDYINRYPEQIAGFCLFFSSAMADDDLKKAQRERAASLVLEDKTTFIKLGITNLFDSNTLEKNRSGIEETIKMAHDCTAEAISAVQLGMRNRTEKLNVLTQKYPKQIIYGTYDTAINKEVIENQIDIAHNCIVAEIPCGHMGHFEATEACQNALEQFFKSIK